MSRPPWTKSVEEFLEESETSRGGESSILDLSETVHEEASAVANDPNSDVVIDEVEVEQIGDTRITGAAVDGVSDAVSAVVDVQITRHIEGDDVDWIEIIPHEVTVNTESGEIEAVIPHDTEYQLEQNSAESTGGRLMDTPIEETPSTLVKPTALSATNRQKAAVYARKWALSYNPSYKKYDLDCTNFVSQAMLQGGWKEKFHVWVDYKWDTAWWYGGIPTNSWTWSSAENFYRMTKALNRSTTAKYVTDLRVGDLLQYKNKGSSTMSHSMVVTKKSGANIYLSYHSVNTLNKPFSALKNLNVTWYGHHV